MQIYQFAAAIAAKCYLSNACRGQKSPPQTELGSLRNLHGIFMSYTTHLCDAAAKRLKQPYNSSLFASCSLCSPLLENSL